MGFVNLLAMAKGCFNIVYLKVWHFLDFWTICLSFLNSMFGSCFGLLQTFVFHHAKHVSACYLPSSSYLSFPWSVFFLIFYSGGDWKGGVVAGSGEWVGYDRGLGERQGLQCSHFSCCDFSQAKVKRSMYHLKNMSLLDQRGEERCIYKRRLKFAKLSHLSSSQPPSSSHISASCSL